jgi:hypothetical protein
VAAAGAPADTDRMIAMLKAHATICEYEASVGCDVDTIDTNKALSKDALLVSSPARATGLSVQAVAHLARTHIATQLRSRSPSNICLLVAGMML